MYLLQLLDVGLPCHLCRYFLLFFKWYQEICKTNAKQVSSSPEMNCPEKPVTELVMYYFAGLKTQKGLHLELHKSDMDNTGVEFKSRVVFLLLLFFFIIDWKYDVINI